MRVTSVLLVSLLALCVLVLAAGAEEKKNKYSKYVIGIDLGTTYSCVGVYKDGKVEMIANEQGNRITPSYVAFTETGERLIGDAAKNQATLNPQNTIYDIKRFIGRRYTDATVRRDQALLPFTITNKDGRPHVSVQTSADAPTKVYSPEEISSMVLTKMKDVAETYLGEKVEHAVVTVPAYFNDAQRKATKDAGKIAGLNVLRIINEPTAAAIAYGLDRQNEDHAILVFDLGGGTFDVTILTIDKGIFDVLSTNGDTHLGGEDFDQRVVEFYIKKIKSEHQVDISKNKRALAKLRRAAEVAKRALSTELVTSIDLDGILPDGEDFSDTLTRAKFEQLNEDLFQKTMSPVDKALKDSGLKKSEIAEVVLVGGSTKIPRVQEILSKWFEGKKLNKKVNPDEAVAYGAAVQAAILNGQSVQGEAVVLDVAPLSLGMEVVGGVMLTFVKRNEKIPLRVTKTLTTEADYQTSVPITIFQGERPRAKDNVKLGHFDLGGIPPMKRGMPQVEVTFEIDEDSILHVSAVDTATKNQQALTIGEQDGSTLSQEDIDRMVEESENFAETDKAWKERQDKASEVEHYMYEMQHALETDAVKAALGGIEKNKITRALKDADKWLDERKETKEKLEVPELEEDTKSFQAKLTELRALIDPILGKLYTPNEHSSANEDDEGDLHEEL